MALTKDDIEYIANLAKLEISEAEVAPYTDKLGRIVEFIDELSKADTDDLLPMAHPLDMGQRLRADAARGPEDRDHYQENAPATEQGLYLVPRVIE
jgi:aspartyl-tRNA(Asn)/glutamyl-tRNA(Gln) amidotransferase subunit C